MRRLENKVDLNYQMVRGKFEYPHIVIEEPTEELPVLVGCLSTGGLPLVVFFNGGFTQVASIAKTPMTLSKVLNLYPITVSLKENIQVEIRNIQELMDLEDFNWGGQ